MQPRIETLTEKKLIDKRMIMTLADDKTGELWKSFMSRRREINNSLTTEMIAMQVYAPSYFHNFNPHQQFEKWATVEVANFNRVPNELETFTLPIGLYAIFIHKGPSADNRTFQYIFRNWLPSSNYLLDDRPRFEILGAKYKNVDPNSEEEIGIPIKPRKESVFRRNLSEQVSN